MKTLNNLSIKQQMDECFKKLANSKILANPIDINSKFAKVDLNPNPNDLYSIFNDKACQGFKPFSYKFDKENFTEKHNEFTSNIDSEANIYGANVCVGVDLE